MVKKKLKKNKNGLVVYKLGSEELKRQYCLKNGKPLTTKELSSITGYSMVVLKTWEKELPMAISVIAHLMKDLNLTFDQLVKEVYE